MQLDLIPRNELENNFSKLNKESFPQLKYQFLSKLQLEF